MPRSLGYLNSSRPKLGEIIWAVEQITGIGARSLMDRSRHPWLVEARWVLFWIGHRRHGYSLPRIGAFMGRDHTTILHGIQQIDRRFSEFETVIGQVEKLLAEPIATPA